jgi:hypothetical protein
MRIALFLLFICISVHLFAQGPAVYVVEFNAGDTAHTLLIQKGDKVKITWMVDGKNKRVSGIISEITDSTISISKSVVPVKTIIKIGNRIARKKRITRTIIAAAVTTVLISCTAIVLNDIFTNLLGRTSPLVKFALPVGLIAVPGTGIAIGISCIRYKHYDLTWNARLSVVSGDVLEKLKR